MVPNDRADYRCPWCGAAFAGHLDDLDSDRVEMECYRCGRPFEADVWVEPRYQVRLPAEMDRCPECPWWDGEGSFCAYDFPDGASSLAGKHLAVLGMRLRPLGDCPAGR